MNTARASEDPRIMTDLPFAWAVPIASAVAPIDDRATAEACRVETKGEVTRVTKQRHTELHAPACGSAMMKEHDGKIWHDA